MRVFITGASGWIGSAVVPELLSAGHDVVGLARSDASATAIAALGAQVFRGLLDDPKNLREGAALSDGVIHLGYNHDFSRMEEAAVTDRNAIEAIGTVLKNSDRPFVVAGGVLGLAPGRIATESDQPESSLHPRTAQASLPVFSLSGILDPIVPWPFVRRWLGKNCPALRDYRIIRSADHNVLSTAPAEAAKQVLEWMSR